MSPSSENGTAQLTLQAAAQIRGLIIDRVFLPGEKVRQVELAERIGVSRSPLREALRTLEAEGVLAYEVNRGYVVSRLDDEDLAQIHRMRSLLEGELLRTLKPPTAEQLEALDRTNDELAAAVEKRNVAEIVRLNQTFHFAIFTLSPLNQVRAEVTRLWQLSDIYSAAWWWRTEEAGPRIITEHQDILAALGTFEIESLVELCEAHRTGGHEHLTLGSAAR